MEDGRGLMTLAKVNGLSFSFSFSFSFFFFLFVLEGRKIKLVVIYFLFTALPTCLIDVEIFSLTRNFMLLGIIIYLTVGLN
jgi:hypothetical protein